MVPFLARPVALGLQRRDTEMSSVEDALRAWHSANGALLEPPLKSSSRCPLRGSLAITSILPIASGAL